MRRRAPKSTDLPGLEGLALEQGGYFRREDAHAHGLSDRLLSYHTRTGRFERVLPGVFRVARAPIARNDELVLAWVWSRYRGAISHESALALYGLSDLLPARVQVTVPPDERRRSDHFVLHRSRLGPEEVMAWDGVLATTPARAIVDAAARGAEPEQIEKAIRQALERALVSPEHLRVAAGRAGYRHKRAVERLLDETLRRAPAETRR